MFFLPAFLERNVQASFLQDPYSDRPRQIVCQRHRQFDSAVLVLLLVYSSSRSEFIVRQGMHTLCSPSSRFTPGFPVFPFTFRPKTSCFVRVNLVSKALNCSSIRLNFSGLSGSLSGICFLFRFSWLGLVTEERDSLNLFKWDPFFAILRRKLPSQQKISRRSVDQGTF